MKEQDFDRRHRAMARGLVYGLARHPAADGWADFATLASLRLSEAEIAGMTWAGLKALPAEIAEDVVLAAMPAAGPPMAPFCNPSDDAAWWASVASRGELRAYVTAAWRALPTRDRAAFAARIRASHA